MDNGLITEEIRSLLSQSQDWTDGLRDGDSAKAVAAYVATIHKMIQERKINTAKFHKHHIRLTTFTYTAGSIGVGSGVAASVLYALNTKKGTTSDGKNMASLVFSVMTGMFVFIAGCGQLIADYKRYGKRASSLGDENRLLEILCRTIVNKHNIVSDAEFRAVEQEIFGTTAAVGLE